MKAVDRLIFPLDVPKWDMAQKIVATLNGHVGWFKVGLELFIAEGPSVLDRVRQAAPETKIFLDLKLHDIPATVGQAMASASQLGADMITIHSQGGTDMLRAAVANAGDTTVLAITVLTSLNPALMSELSPEQREPGALVRFLGEQALNAGCQGLVASGHEVASLRSAFGPKPRLIIPGIRPKWAQVPGDDQKRTATPAQALQAGADYLVVGRPIRDAQDPALAADRVVEELSAIQQ